MKPSNFMAVGKTGLLVTGNPEGEGPNYLPGSTFYIGETPLLPCHIPADVLYSFYWPGLGNFGIPHAREISFTATDMLHFQPAGYCEDHPLKPLYYIKRESDHKLLSFTLGGPAYTENHSSPYQKWLVSRLGLDKYCLLLPCIPGCFFIRPVSAGKEYFLSVTRSRNIKDSSSVAIYMKELRP